MKCRSRRKPDTLKAAQKRCQRLERKVRELQQAASHDKYTTKVKEVWLSPEAIRALGEKIDSRFPIEQVAVQDGKFRVGGEEVGTSKFADKQRQIAKRIIRPNVGEAETTVFDQMMLQESLARHDQALSLIRIGLEMLES